MISKLLRGFRREKAPLDLRSVTNDPVEAAKLAQGGRFIIEVPVANIRFLGFWGADAHNPLVLTVRGYAEGKFTRFKGSPMEDFYSKWQPYASARGQDAMRPWKTFGRKDPRNSAAGRLQRREFREVAADVDASPDEIRGHIKGGPVTEAFGEITFRRMAGIHDSILRDGFRPENSPAGYPSGVCYVREDGDYRVSIGSGKHRVTVMLAMGWPEIPVELGPRKLPVITRRSEVDEWPNVRSGHYSREEALKAFDEVFRREHPSGWRWPAR